MRSPILAAALAFLWTTIATANSTIFRIEARIYTASGPSDGVVRLVTESGKTITSPMTAPGTLPPTEAIREIRVGGGWIAIHGAGEPRIEGAEPEAIALLSAPAIMTEENFEAAIQSGTSANLQYFALATDGHFELKTVDQATGLMFRVTPKTAERGIELLGELEVTALAARQPLEGVALDVGKPMVNRQSSSIRVVIAPGRWFLVSGHAMRRNGHTDLVLMLLRVDRVE